MTGLEFEDYEFIQALCKKLTDEEAANLMRILSKIDWLEGWRKGALEGIQLSRPVTKQATDE